MADITITPANVKLASTAGDKPSIDKVIAGETLTHVMPVYRSNDGKYYKCDASDPDKLACEFITLGAAAADEWVTVISAGDFKPGATLVANTTYVVSAASPGRVCPQADLAVTNGIVILGTARSTDTLRVAIDNTGITL